MQPPSAAMQSLGTQTSWAASWRASRCVSVCSGAHMQVQLVLGAAILFRARQAQQMLQGPCSQVVACRRQI